jgi:hypothetical protein
MVVALLLLLFKAAAWVDHHSGGDGKYYSSVPKVFNPSECRHLISLVESNGKYKDDSTYGGVYYNTGTPAGLNMSAHQGYDKQIRSVTVWKPLALDPDFFWAWQRIVSVVELINRPESGGMKEWGFSLKTGFKATFNESSMKKKEKKTHSGKKHQVKIRGIQLPSLELDKQEVMEMAKQGRVERLQVIRYHPGRLQNINRSNSNCQSSSCMSAAFTASLQYERRGARHNCVSAVVSAVVGSCTHYVRKQRRPL